MSTHLRTSSCPTVTLLQLKRRHRCQLNHPRRPDAARATIRDVAALAGVGIKTVSRVINDEANVSPQMRERVAARDRAP